MTRLADVAMPAEHGGSTRTLSGRPVAHAMVGLLVVLASRGDALAGVNLWTGTGPEGGTVTVLAVDPVTPTTDAQRKPSSRCCGRRRGADAGTAARRRVSRPSASVLIW